MAVLITFVCSVAGDIGPKGGKVWTDRLEYRMGDSVTFFVELYGVFPPQIRVYLLVQKPDGTTTSFNLGSASSGVRTVMAIAGPPSGTRQVNLVLGSDGDAQVLSTCYFNVIEEQVTKTVTTTVNRATTLTADRTVWRTSTANPVTVTRTLTEEVTTTVYSPTITVTITKTAQMQLNLFLWLGIETMAVFGMTNAPEKTNRIKKLVLMTINLFPLLKPLDRLSWKHVREFSFGTFLVCLVALSFSSIESYPAFAGTVTKTETVTEWRTEWTTRTYQGTTWSTPTVFATLDKRSTRTVYVSTTVTTTVTVNPVAEALANTGIGTAIGIGVGGIVTTIAGRGLAGAAGLGLAGLTSGLSGTALLVATLVPGAVAGGISAIVYVKTQEAGWSKPASILASTAGGTAVGTATTVGAMLAMGFAVPPIGAAIVVGLAVSAAVSLFMNWALKH